MEYLSIEDQFKDILNNEEISRIRDNELREIRERYWRKQLQAFKAEHEIPDSLLEEVSNRLREAEKAEIAAYRKKHNL